MGRQAFRVRLPQRSAVEVTAAEFLLRTARQAKDLGRRAALLGALTELPKRQRANLAQATAEACRLFADAKLPATVRLGIGELNRQRVVQVVVVAEPAEGENDAAYSLASPAAMEKLQRLTPSVLHLQVNDFPGPGATVLIAQAAPAALRIPSERELEHWGELLRADTTEDAVALAQQRSRHVSREANVGAAPAVPGAAQQAEADRDDLETLSLVVAHTTNAILIMDSDGVIQWTNNACYTLTGYAPEEVIGRRFDEILFGPSTAREAVREFEQALRNGHETAQDVLQYHRDGRTVWVECKLIPVYDEHGRAARWIAIESDITRRRQTEEALRAAKQAAESTSRAKSEFLANMSHEIRTPLNAVLGMTELALATDLTREQRDYLRTVQSSAEALLQLLNDVLDVSKIEAGKMEIEEIDFNLAEVVRETLKALAVKAHEKGLELAVHMPMSIPQNFRGDPLRIRQVLFNLVGNAIKFTERGEVIVDVEEQWQDAEEACLHFSVRDTGIGIPKEKLEQIFEAFAQADSSMARRFGGAGLGLTITAQLLRLMGGKIWVQSKPNEGSNFHFTLRLRLGRPPAVQPAAADATQLQGKRALVVDDNAANRRILDEMLSHWGLRATPADGATAAIKELEDAARAGCPFDLILLDAMMPVVDGFQLADMIRQRPDLQFGTVMMLSSADRPNSSARCRQLGIASFLVKPVSASALLEAILAALGEPKREGKAEAPTEQSFQHDGDAAPTARPKRALRVLVADDHEPNRSLAMKVLKRRGHRCIPAADGDEAVAACAQEAFDIVLMDVQMPGRDGFSATRLIREREQRTGAHVPIVALTAHALSGDREKCLAAGMDAYLAKPLHARELVALVERITGVGPEDPSDAPRTGPPPPAAGFDFNAALERMNGEVDLLREHLNYMLNDAPRLVQQMREATRRRDGRQLEIAAHRLKGLVGSYNFQEAGELAVELERSGKESRFDKADGKLDRLDALMQDFSRAAAQFLRRST